MAKAGVRNPQCLALLGKALDGEGRFSAIRACKHPASFSTILNEPADASCRVTHSTRWYELGA